MTMEQVSPSSDLMLGVRRPYCFTEKERVVFIAKNDVETVVRD